MTEKTDDDRRNDKVYLDDILNKFSIFGRYHCVVGALIFIAYASNTFYCVNYVFVVENVGYTCASTNQCDVSINNISSEGGQCYQRIPVDDKTACSDQNVTNTKLVACTKWIYDNPDSFVGEFDLGCQDWKVALVGTVHSFAYMVGLLIVGPLSDRLGRKRAAILTGILGGVFGLARSFTYNYWVYIILEFLESAIGDSCSPFFTLNIEIAGTKFRSLYYAIIQFGYPTGSVLFALVAWKFQYWRTLLRVMYTPGLLFALYYFVIDESPRWLLIKGKKDEAVVILEKMANKNKIKIDKQTLNDLTYEKDDDNNISQLKLLQNTFKSRKLLKRFMVCLIWWITSTFVSYGISVNSVLLKGNKYLNYLMISAVDFPASILMGFVLMKFKRKIPLLISFFAGAIFFLIEPFLPLDLPWLSLVFFMAGRASNTLFFSITYVFTSELFPTYTRNSMHALCSSLGRIGSILAPQTPLLLKYSSKLPAVLFGCTCLIAGLVTLLVPDTAKEDLPDTVKQAEKVGKEHIIHNIEQRNNVIL